MESLAKEKDEVASLQQRLDSIQNELYSDKVMEGLTEDELVNEQQRLDRIQKNLDIRLDNYNKSKDLVMKQQQERKDEEAATAAKEVTRRKLKIYEAICLPLLAHQKFLQQTENRDEALMYHFRVERIRRRDSVTEI